MQLWAKERADKQAAQLAAEQQESMLKAKREARLQREMKIIVSHARCLLLPPTANYCHQLPTTTTTTTLSLLACYCYLLWVWMVPVLLTAPWLDGASSTYSPRPSNQWGCRPSKPSWWVHCPSAPLPPPHHTFRLRPCLHSLSLGSLVAPPLCALTCCAPSPVVRPLLLCRKLRGSWRRISGVLLRAVTVRVRRRRAKPSPWS